MAARARHALNRAWTLIFNAFKGIGTHHGTQLAAAMAYYALFSVFPAAILIAAIGGLVLDDPAARDDAIDYLLDQLPLSEDEGRTDLDSLLDGVTRNSGTLGLIGAIGLLVSASALLGAARNAVNVISGERVVRGAVRGKGLDILLVLVLGTLFSASFAATVIAGLDVRLDGGIGAVIQSVLDTTGVLVPLVFAALVFAVMFMRLPPAHASLRDVWPGVVFATLGYELVRRGFAFYLDQFADYSAVYGSLGAVVAFMVFVYVAALAFLIGAEIAALWPRVRAGEFDSSDDDEPGDPFALQLRDFLLDLFRRRPA